MQPTSKFNRLTKQHENRATSPVQGGLAVRTNLRAGLAWDDLDDKALELWNNLTSTVSNAAQSVTSDTTASS